MLGWQQFLLKPNAAPKLRGFKPILTVDGIFGMQTARATAEFQRRVGLIGDGVVGSKTFDAARTLGMNTVLFLPGSPLPPVSPNQVTVPVIPYGPPLPPPPGPTGPMGSTREISWKRLRAEGWRTADGVRAGLAADNSVLQSANDGSGDYIYDEYRIDITAMPDKLTPEAFLLELARDLNGTIKSGDFDFINVFKRRAGGTPGAREIIDINIQGPDNGSVVLGEITPTYFIFQTIDTPRYGSHPEYGSREFGFQRNGSTVTFYTRGVSRPGSFIIGLVGAEPQRKGWTALLNGIASVIVARGGKADFASFAATKEKRNN